MRLGLITILIFLALLGALQPDTYYVTSLGRGDFVYRSLDQAIAAAKPGSTIEIKPGVYRGNFIIDKPLWIRASAGDAPVLLQASDPEQPVFKITADNVRISGLLIEGGSVGIELDGVQNCKLIGNELRDNGTGLLLRDARDNLLRGNHVRNSAQVGIELCGSTGNRLLQNSVAGAPVGLQLSDSARNLLAENKIAGNGTGLLLRSSEGNELQANQIIDNTQGIVFEHAQANVLRGNSFGGNRTALQVIGDTSDDWLEDIDTTNTLDGRAIYYLVDEENRSIDARANPGYIVLVRCRGISIAGLNLINMGIRVIASESITIRGNRISQAGQAIYLWETHNSSLENNTISDAQTGIMLQDSSAVIIAHNRIGKSEIGILLDGGAGNLLENNTITESARHGIVLTNSNSNKLRVNEIRASGQYGIFLDKAAENGLEQNSISGSWVGIFLQDALANDLLDNTVQDSNYGIYLARAKDNRVERNKLTGNTRAGLGGSLEGNKIAGNEE